MGYGLNAYFSAIRDALGESWAEELNSIWGTMDAQRDLKMTNLLLAEMLVQMKELNAKHGKAGADIQKKAV